MMAFYFKLAMLIIDQDLDAVGNLYALGIFP